MLEALWQFLSRSQFSVAKLNLIAISTKLTASNKESRYKNFNLFFKAGDVNITYGNACIITAPTVDTDI